MSRQQSLKTYLLYILVAVSLIMTVASLQFYFNYDEIKPQILLAPTVVGVLVGYLLASQRILRDKMEEQQSRFVSLVDMAEEFTYLQNVAGDYTYVSPACESITGYPAYEFYIQPSLLERLVVAEDRVRWRQYQEQLSPTDTDRHSIEIRVRHKHGHSVWIRHTRQPILEGDLCVGYRASNSEISEYVAQKQSLKNLSEKDPLTGLPNRRKLNEFVGDLLQADKPFYLVMMDLDRFKYINDSLGHSFGDELLVMLSQRLRKGLSVEVMLARFGGDEFVFVLPSSLDVESVIADILLEVKRPVLLKGYQLQVSASFGWVSAPEDGDSVDSLVMYADAAMYDAKQKPGVSQLSYQHSSESVHSRVLDIEHRLKAAVTDKKIKPYYQPIVDASSQQVVGVESLARWHDDELGWVRPDEFIPLAEATNLIGELGMQMMEQAVVAASRLSQRSSLPIYFSVNVSALQLIEEGFVGKVVDLLQSHALAPSYLKIEVTESLFIGGNLQAMQVLSELREYGIQIALDDFGTGYSALAVLRDQCIDILKVDRAFVRELEQNSVDQALVKQIIAMAHMMGMKVIAEGVETDAQADYLQAVECEMLQGYLFGKPMAEEDFCHWLGERLSD